MRLAISNIAWDANEDEEVAALLQRHAIDAIDVAPSKYFAVPAEATAQDIAKVRAVWADRGIEITGMQSLLFGTTGLNIFGPVETRAAMLDHLAVICRIGGGLGARKLVFGSPRNRDRGEFSDEEVLEIALPFFRYLGQIALDNGVVICLEPNPVRYGANFMTDSGETAAVVRQVGHAGIKMQFDTGALSINAEDAEAVLRDCAPLIGHVHASEADLLPLGEAGGSHADFAAALRRHLPDHVVSIEMVATKTEPHPAAIERAIRVADRHYRLGGQS
jgi:D-psicose/D-tagatose/L-ribulose 3-epimerase